MSNVSRELEAQWTEAGLLRTPDWPDGHHTLSPGAASPRQGFQLDAPGAPLRAAATVWRERTSLCEGRLIDQCPLQLCMAPFQLQGPTAMAPTAEALSRLPSLPVFKTHLPDWHAFRIHGHDFFAFDRAVSKDRRLHLSSTKASACLSAMYTLRSTEWFSSSTRTLESAA